MYSTLPHFVLGFHGCDKSVADEIISHSNNHLEQSTNEYDWLGHGIYFWENNPARALEYATFLKNHPERISKGKRPIVIPAVVGAVIDLGYCLNLLESHSLDVVKESYKILKDFFNPRNRKCLKTWSQREPMNCFGEIWIVLLLKKYIRLTREVAGRLTTAFAACLSRENRFTKVRVSTTRVTSRSA